MHQSTERARGELAARLRVRRGEIESETLARVHGIADPSKVRDPRYVDGLRLAVSAAIDYGIDSLESGEELLRATPPILLAQARIAARNDVSFDTVMRRYLAGYMLLREFLSEEADQIGLDRTAVKALIQSQTTLFERLVETIGQTLTRERDRRPRPREQWLAMRIDSLLAGERVDCSDIPYDFSAHHLCVIAVGAEAEAELRALVAHVDCALLLDRRDGDRIAGWLGSRRQVCPGDVIKLASNSWPDHLLLAIGEPGYGRSGWRTTYEQAMAAHAAATRGLSNMVRYADSVLLTSTLRDGLATTSLETLFLAPLERERDGGAELKRTLRAYLAAQRNISSTAHALGISRQTVASRLRSVEERLDRPLCGCFTQLEVALQLDELEAPIT